MKDSFIKTKNFLNRDVNEFNKLVLSVICITILALAAIASYTITNSYAAFSSELEGAKTLKFHPTKEFSVYITGSSGIGYNLDEGEYTGYCLEKVNAAETSNKASNNNAKMIQLTNASYCDRVYPTQALCTSAGTTIWGSGNYSCTNGTWTASGIEHYTTNPSNLSSDVFIKNNINANNQVTSSEVCYVYSEVNTSPTPKSAKESDKKLTPILLSGTIGQIYCLKGGDAVYNNGTWTSPHYSDNVDILEDIFGANNCTDNSTYYLCARADGSGGSAYQDGAVMIGNASGDTCTIEYDTGFSYCLSGR